MKYGGAHTGASAGQSLGRMLALKIGLLAFFLVVACRLIQIQVIDAPKLQAEARRQYEAKVVLPATRGNLFDRNGRLLVSNTMFVSFGADPKMIGTRAEAIATRFANAFDKPRSYYMAKLAQDDRHFIWLERRVKPQFSRVLRIKDFAGTLELGEPKRLYHYDHVGGQLIGFTDIDNHGLSGLELELERYLHGTDGHVIMQRDGLGRQRPSVDYPRVEPRNGNHAVLTIDAEYQAIAEEELAKGVERMGAESGLVVMLDPATGEVLAMANYPSINPNDIARADQAMMRNRAITDMFEPGSVFKVVTAAAALEHNLVKPEQKIYAEQGRYLVKLPGGTTRPITDTHEYGMITFQEGMELSSNIVMAKVSDLIGAELLYTTARDFGFGTDTGVDLPGEVSGDLKKPTQWSGATLNSMAYGYEVGVTPLQIAAAYGAVANKGVLMKPYVVKQILDEHYEPVVTAEPQVIRKVISKTTAQTLTKFFEGVVERGTGKPAKLADVRVAGKTGTSRKFVGGKYETGSYTASFVGYFPAEDPKVVCLVMLDKPKTGGYTGGVASAPIFKGIAAKIFATSGRFTRKQDPMIAGSQQFSVPDVTSLKLDAAKGMLASCGFDVSIEGDGSVVRQQHPEPGARRPRGTVVTLATLGSEAVVPAGYTVIPDVRGLSVRRAVNRLAAGQLDADLAGSGIVTAQSPSPGEQVRAGSHVAIRCEPRSLSMVSVN